MSVHLAQKNTVNSSNCVLYVGILPGGTNRLPSPTRINSSVCPSVCPSVRACRLGIEQKMAQAQQIRSIIVNRESEILRKKYISESNTVNNMKLMILE